MDISTPNPDPNDEMKKRAREYLLIRICNKYKDTNSRTFTVDDIEIMLQGFGAKFLDYQIREIFKGWGVIEFANDSSLCLTEYGKKVCDDSV